MAWKHWLSKNKDWCCHSMHGCQYNGWFLMSMPNKPFSPTYLLCFQLVLTRIQLHGCQWRCRSLWGLSMLISGSSSSLFIPPSCFLYLSKSSLPGLFEPFACVVPIGCFRGGFFFSTLHCVKTILADSCLCETGASVLCQPAALWQQIRRCKKKDLVNE